MDNYKWDLEKPNQRGDMIKIALELFGPERRILMRSSDSLEYVFDNIAEAISFVIYRVKEVDDVKDTFTDTKLGNYGSSDMYIYITTNHGSYTLKMLDSYEYTEKTRTEMFNAEHERLKRNSSPRDELDYMFSSNKELFINSIKSKATLLKKEIDCHKPHIIESSDQDIHKLLNRYFFDGGWREYWFTVSPISHSTNVNVTMSIKLSEGTIIDIPIEPKSKTSIVNKQKKTKVIKKI